MRFDVDRDIVFVPFELKSKTQAWEVMNKLAGDSIGVVKWYPAWRHYCFFPDHETVFSDRCMLKIGQFVEAQNRAHRGS